MYQCNDCSREFEKKQSYCSHKAHCPTEKANLKGRKGGGGRKGVKSGSVCCLMCQSEFSANGLGVHIWRIHGTGKNHKSALGCTPKLKGHTYEEVYGIAGAERVKKALTEKLRGKRSFSKKSPQEMAVIKV